jgi:predicted flavoprotein YhiN
MKKFCIAIVVAIASSTSSGQGVITSMESSQPGLYFIGEVVDVTGWLGGYNFQWAWASAYACARALASLPAATA